MFDVKTTIPKSPLYRTEFEHDNCGIGACVNIKGKKSRAIVENALKIVENLEHRAGKDAEGETGDGVGILTQMPHKFMAKVTKDLGFAIGSTAWARSSSRRTNCSAIRRRRCLRSLPGRKGWNF